jgi:hypothetical protein
MAHVILDPDRLLGTLHPEARVALERFFRGRREVARVVSGRRSCLVQNTLYAASSAASDPSQVATRARGCQSWHVLGRAVDVRLVRPDGKDNYDCAAYRSVGEAWQRLGGVWGGSFSGFGACGDQFHFEWHPGRTLADECPDPDACAAVELRVDAAISRQRMVGVAVAVAVAVCLALALVAGRGQSWT